MYSILNKDNEACYHTSGNREHTKPASICFYCGFSGRHGRKAYRPVLTQYQNPRGNAQLADCAHGGHLRVAESWVIKGRKAQIDTIVERENLMLMGDTQSQNGEYFPEYLQVLRPWRKRMRSGPE
jgi:hypothetical protein